MADSRWAKFRDFPIWMYVDAILERDPGKSLLDESVCDYNDSENQANQRSMSNHIVPVETNAPEPSEVERTGQEIVVYQEPIEYSDDCETSSQNDSDSDFKISEDSENELQDDAAVFELETVKEHVTPFKRTSVQPAKVLELEIPKLNETGVKTDKAKITTNDSDNDTSRTISDIPTRLGNVSRCPNDESVNGGINNNENNIPVGDATSGKKVNKIKEKKPILVTRIKKYLEGPGKKSDKFSVPKVNSGKRGGSKARQTIDVEDDDDGTTLFLSRKRKANKIDLNKKPKEVNIKKPRFDEAETSKRGAARCKPVVVLALEANKQKAVPADEPRPVVTKPLTSGPKDHVDEIDRLFAGRKVPKGLRSRSVFGRVGEIEKNKAVQVEDQQLNAARPLNGAPKELKSQAEKNNSFRKVKKAVCLGDGEIGAHKPKELIFYGLLRGSRPCGSVLVQPGEAIKKNSVKADELRLNAAKPSNSGQKKLKSKAEENDCVRKVNKDVHLSDSETGTDKSPYGFGGLLRFEPSGSVAVVCAGQSNKQKAVQAKDIGADKHKASGSRSGLGQVDEVKEQKAVQAKDIGADKHKASGSRSGLGQVDEVKEQKAAAKAIEPWFDVVKETNNGPKWHAKCKESGVCSGLDKGGPSASVPVWGRANSWPVDHEVMVCQVNYNPADFETVQRFMRRKLR